MSSIFLDYNATTPVASEVLEAMLPYFSEYYGNASSSHAYGQKALRAIDTARLQVASLICSKVDEIYFTGSGTESNNTALIGIANKLKSKGNRIITTRTEHSSVYNTCRYLESCDFEVVYLEVDSDGLIRIDELKQAINDRTILVSIIMANNETGVVQNIKELSSIVKGKSVLFHTDAVQAAGKISLDVNALGVDLMSISAHKIYAPKGIGALFIKRGISLFPLIHGGGQERKLRSGTENVPAIVGFGKAAELARLNLKANIENLTLLKKTFEKAVLNSISCAKINGINSHKTPNTSNISFVGTDSETLLVKLDLNGICVSSGSACGASSLEPSRTLRAMGLSEDEQSSAIRFSLGLQTTQKELLYTVEVLKKLIR